MGRNYDRVLLFMACTVTIVWAVTIIVQTFFPSHHPPSSVNEVMVIVATGFFSGAVITSALGRNGRNGRNGSTTDEHS